MERQLLPWEQEVPPRILKLIHFGLETGWHDTTSLVARFKHPTEQPFFAKWMLSPDGKYRFDQARVLRKAGGLAPLNFRDIPIYMQDPSVIEETDPNACQD